MLRRDPEGLKETEHPARELNSGVQIVSRPPDQSPQFEVACLSLNLAGVGAASRFCAVRDRCHVILPRGISTRAGNGKRRRQTGVLEGGA
jgi:hypothetical protein